MKKNGFTLIELLAVIVILAIIALIATPTVLNVISKSSDRTILMSAEFYLDAVDFSILNSEMNKNKIVDGTYDVLDNGNICKEKGECITVDVKGKIPNSG